MKSTPKDVFLHLIAIITLYISAGSLLVLFFQYINIAFPDALNAYNDHGSTIRGALASLIIVFPIFFWISGMLEKGIRSNPERANLRIRKWLIAFTLFVAALAIIGDLITLVRFFLEGDLTARFVLKVVAVFAVAGSVFWYYLRDFKREGAKLPTGAKTFPWIVASVVGITIVGGFFVAGSPFTQREIRFDQTRISHLNEIQRRIVNYWSAKKVLPNSLEDLKDNISGFTAPVDPETGEAYEYQKLGTLSFELCANFLQKSKNAFDERSMPISDGVSQNWDHDAGRVCFERTIDPDFYGIQKF